MKLFDTIEYIMLRVIVVLLFMMAITNIMIRGQLEERIKKLEAEKASNLLQKGEIKTK